MLFSSIIFLFYFLPVVCALYFIVPARFNTIRNLILLLASLFFYSWGEPVYVFLMIYSSVFNFFMARQIEKDLLAERSDRANLIFTVVVNLFILGFFKYFGFLIDTINGILRTDFHYTALSLPIGISFYTFQALSYIFDVHKKTVPAQKNLLHFALYVALFPQLIAGPIVKYRDVAEQLQHRTTSLDKFGQGTVRFILGLGKKVLLANTFGALYEEITAYGNGDQATVLTFWIGALAYTLQIYFDFSGYSDMAIGLGKIFGFDFLENFNYPYISRSITDFWRRWHISLSSWFRDYVYFPLGGSYVDTKRRHIFNLLVVWALTGLWHGAAWNFVFWGMYYGIILIIEKYIIGERLTKIPGILQHVYTLFIVMVGWIFFSSASLGAALHYLSVMFGFGAHGLADITTLYHLRTSGILLFIGCIAATPYPIAYFRKFVDRHAGIALLVIFGIFLLSVAYLVYSSYNPFLYFRF